jgi:hypothetical protein
MTGDDRKSIDDSEAAPSLMRTGDGRAVTDEQAGPPPTQARRPVIPARPVATGWPVWLSAVVLLLFLGFHLFAGTARFLGEPASVLNRILSPLPFGQLLAAAAIGWTWLPGWAVIGATALRVRALGQMLRNPLNGAAMALLACLFEAGMWLFAGRGRTPAPGETAAMAWVLALEIAVLVSLVALLLLATPKVAAEPSPGGPS